jgi:hypothetical protein
MRRLDPAKDRPDPILPSGLWFLVSAFEVLPSAFWLLVSGFWFLVSSKQKSRALRRGFEEKTVSD